MNILGHFILTTPQSISLPSSFQPPGLLGQYPDAVKKPQGQARRNYNIQEAAGIDPAVYKVMKVRSFFPLTSFRSTHRLRPSKNVIRHLCHRHLDTELSLTSQQQIRMNRLRLEVSPLLRSPFPDHTVFTSLLPRRYSPSLSSLNTTSSGPQSTSSDNIWKTAPPTAPRRYVPFRPCSLPIPNAKNFSLSPGHRHLEEAVGRHRWNRLSWQEIRKAWRELSGKLLNSDLTFADR